MAGLLSGNLLRALSGSSIDETRTSPLSRLGLIMSLALAILSWLFLSLAAGLAMAPRFTSW